MAATEWQNDDESGAPSPFDVALRGYDRRQVDERLAALTAELAAVRHALDDAEMRADELTEQLRIAIDRARQAGGRGQDNSFGFRVEKILKLAQEEAKEVRAQGAAEARSMVERARAGAAAELEEAARLRDEAQRSAEEAWTRVRGQAAALAAQVDRDLAVRRQAAEQDLDRLVTARDQVRAELVRMREILRNLSPAWPGADAAG
ncbi:MAG TPA: hypothetical protein VGD67_28435, partial [Pseudonocardiaceae bacterium]